VILVAADVLRLQDLGRAGEALPLQQRALAISQKAFVPDHPQTAAIRGNLGGD
jgi:hypothetical protein